MSVFPGGIPVVTIIMTVQKILHIQFIQFTLTDNFLPISKRGFLQQGKKFITFISDTFVRFVCQSLVLKKAIISTVTLHKSIVLSYWINASSKRETAWSFLELMICAYL